MTGTDHPPPPPRNVDDVIRAMSKGGGGGVLVNAQEWGCFSIFWRADDVTRTMFKGCVCVLMNVFTPPLRKSCIHACNMPSRSVEIKQPPQRRPKLAIHCRVPLSLYCRVSPPPQPGLAVSTSRSCRIHCRVPLPLLPGPAVSTAGSRRLYCWVPPSLCSRLTPGLSP